MKEQRQRVFSNRYGDCFGACMASLLELPVEVMPNDHSEVWFDIWQIFLGQFGLQISHGSPNHAIWASHPWVASVKSKNYEETTHAIVMHNGGEVLFDPSTKKRYTKGENLLNRDVVRGGYIITVSDFTKLHKLQEYRERLNGI